MFHSPLNRSHRVDWGIRAASYLVAAAAGAAGLALWRRTTAFTAAVRRTAVRPVPRETHPEEWSTSLANAGWAEITDASGSALGRARVMLAASGSWPVEGQSLLGELRSLRLTPDSPPLLPGRYWVRFEAGQNAHAIEVTATPKDGADGVPIRWDDLDLPASLVERNAN
ncbi:MAG: hypothetical protein C4558_01110 [Dehalococcoidia bacterium]|nr:MAG: hypothetical protein C4558_01110 [Dehalococcoidia bacterium]